MHRIRTLDAKHDIRYASRMFAICVLLPCLTLAAIAAIAIGTEAHAQDSHAVYRCFPAKAWNAHDEDRPCTALGAVQEDGSVTVYQDTAADTVGVCVLPNPYEERGTYTAHCHRVASQYPTPKH